MAPLSKRQRDMLYVRRLAKSNDMKCIYCNVIMLICPHRHGKRIPFNRVTKDHVIPISFGGRNIRSNYVACCHKCNGDRSDLPADLFALFKIWQRNGEPEL